MLSLMIKLTLASVDYEHTTGKELVVKVSRLGAVYVNAKNISHFSPSDEGEFTRMYSNRDDGFYVIETPDAIIALIEAERRKVAA